MHDRLLNALLSVANVRLVAALRDDRLGFPNDKDLRIFIPDIHLISEKRRKEGKFLYATNFTDLLTGVAGELINLKAGALDGETIVVYQLGDFLDLWREASGADDQLDVAARIKDDHQDLVLALLDDNLNARFLLGNHDFDLYRWPDYTAWERRYYLPDTAQAPPSVILLHGDIFGSSRCPTRSRTCLSSCLRRVFDLPSTRSVRCESWCANRTVPGVIGTIFRTRNLRRSEMFKRVFRTSFPRDGMFKRRAPRR